MSAALTAFEVPFRTSTPQTFLISLGGASYRLTVTWCDPNQSWILNIDDTSGNAIVRGLPLVTGTDLLEQFAYLGITGELIVQSDFNSFAVPTFTNLGQTGHLYFVPTPAAVQPTQIETTLQFSLLWTYRIPSGAPVYSTPTMFTNYGRNTIVFQCWDWYLYTLQAKNGVLDWRKAFSAENYGRAVEGGSDGAGGTMIFGASHDGQIHALDHNGGNLWQFNNLYAREGSGTSSAGTNATNLFDATKSWKSPNFLRKAGLGFGASVKMTSGAANGLTSEIVAVISSTQLQLAGLSVAPSPGDTYIIVPRYSSDIYFQHAGTFKTISGTDYLFVTGLDNGFYCLSVTNVGFTLVWKNYAEENNEPWMLVDDVDGDGFQEAVGASIDGNLYCFNAVTGALKWKVQVDAVNGCGLDAHLVDGDINADGITEILVPVRRSGLIGGGGKVHVIKGTDGSDLAQTVDTGGDIDSGAVILDALPSGYKDFCFGGDSAIAFRANAAGATQWKTVTGTVPGHEINASLQYEDVTNNGIKYLIVCDMSGRMSIIDVLKGQLVGILDVNGGIEGVPLIADIDADGQIELVLTTTAGYVQAYRLVWQ